MSLRLRRAVRVATMRPTAFIPTDVPRSEAHALIHLYNLTDGDNWTNNTNWLTDPVVNNWHGITVSGGHVREIDLRNNNLDGDISAWDLGTLSSLTRFYAFSNVNCRGDIGGWTLPVGLQYLHIHVCDFWGNVSSWILPDSLRRLIAYGNSFTGDLSAWVLSQAMTELRIQELDFTGAPTWAGSVGDSLSMRAYLIQDNGAGVDVDAILDGIHERRDDFTYATPELNIGGTNPPSTGTVQGVCPPTSPAERLYRLVNAQCEGDTHNQWDITHNLHAGRVLLTFDDGHESDHDAYEYAEPKGILGTSYVCTGSIDGTAQLSVAQIQAMDGDGWDIANHTVNHPDLTTLTKEEQRAELVDARTALDGWGLTRASSHVAYPEGKYNDETLEVMDEENMLSGRRVGVDHTFKFPINSWYELRAHSVSSADTVDDIKASIDGAIADNAIVLFYFHRLVASAPTGLDWLLDDYKEIIDYLDDNSIETMTISELYDWAEGEPWNAEE